jgi:poly(3-hydroxybutyrate) depolymerase
MKRIPSILFLAAVLLPLLDGCSFQDYSLPPDPTPYRYDSPTEYFLYLPTTYSPDREWPMFVGIHGSGSSGASCLWNWQEYAESEGFVLVCPSLADENGGWYFDQGVAHLDRILKQVRKNVRVQDKFYLAGYSAGAEFTLLYTYENPNSISGAAILSSGEYFQPWNLARDVLFLFVIGENDSASAVQGAQDLADLLNQNGYSVEVHILPNVGHEITQDAVDLTLDLYRRIYGILP